MHFGRLMKTLTGIGLSVLTSASAVEASEIKFLCAGSLQPAMAVLLRQFTESSGYQVAVSYSSIGNNAERVQNGEAADVMVASHAMIDALAKAGKLLPGSEADIAQIGIGVFVRHGFPKPDMSSVEAFKSALAATTSIVYPDATSGSPVGAYLPSAFEKLGIADDLKPKTKLAPHMSVLIETVAAGEADIGFGPLSDIVAAPGVDFVSPLPSGVQNTTLLSIGVVASSGSQEASQALVGFLSSGAAAGVFKAKGLGRD